MRQGRLRELINFLCLRMEHNFLPNTLVRLKKKLEISCTHKNKPLGTAKTLRQLLNREQFPPR